MVAELEQKLEQKLGLTTSPVVDVKAGTGHLRLLPAISDDWVGKAIRAADLRVINSVKKSI